MTLLLRNNMGRYASRGIRSLMTSRVRGLNARRATPAALQGHEWLIRWGYTGAVPTPLERQLNTPEAIRRVSDKAGFRMVLQAADSSLVPRTWSSWQQFLDVTTSEDGWADAYVIRPSKHSKGNHFYLCRSMADMRTAIAAHPSHYISTFIPKAEEFRVFVVQGRATCVMNKIPRDRTLPVWNVNDGGSFEVVHWDNWHLQAVRKSIEAFNLSGLDFGAVDVIVDNRGMAYVLEINTAPGLKFNDDGTPSYTMQCMAKAFDWIINTGSKQSVPLVEQRGGYKKFIHPAICEQALTVRGT